MKVYIVNVFNPNGFQQPLTFAEAAALQEVNMSEVIEIDRHGDAVCDTCNEKTSG